MTVLISRKTEIFRSKLIAVHREKRCEFSSRLIFVAFRLCYYNSEQDGDQIVTSAAAATQELMRREIDHAQRAAVTRECFGVVRRQLSKDTDENHNKPRSV